MDGITIALLAAQVEPEVIPYVVAWVEEYWRLKVKQDLVCNKGVEMYILQCEKPQQWTPNEVCVFVQNVALYANAQQATRC